MDDTGEDRVVKASPLEGGVEDGNQADAAAFKPKRTGAVVVALALVVLGAALAAFFLLRTTREPLRVLVAVDAEGQWWEGSTTAARLLDNVAPHLNKLGFEVVNGGDPETLKKLEGAVTPEEAAQRVGASFIVTGPLKVEVTELKEAGIVEVRASGALHLAHVDGAARELGNVRTWAGAPEKAEALKLVSESLGWQTFDVLIDGLMQHEAVQAIGKGGDAIAAGKLSAAKLYLEKRASQLDFAKGAYAELRQKFTASDKSPNKVTLHTALERQDSLCATGASGFFAKSSAIRPFYSPVTQSLDFYFKELQQLYWQGVDGKARPVFEGYNVLGYASASPEGAAAAYVEDLYGGATALHVVQGTAPAKRLNLDTKLRLSEPKIAPGGALVAAWARECSRCPAAALVIDTQSGKELYRSDPKLEALGGFVWLGPKKLGVLLRGTAEPGKDNRADDADDDDDDREAPSQRLQAVDFEAQPAKVSLLGSVSGEAQLSFPSASADGRRVVFSRYADDGMNLALFDNEGAKLEPLPVGGARDPALSPAGDKIAFVSGGDIGVYDVAAQKTQRLTETGNDFTLRYPQFALDGKSVYFEVRAKDPVYPKDRSLSAIASVPVP